ncbi:MAG TPA: hypothetical protein VHL80_09055 [Polyangia bacterium]|nr:hypothetical protein [Polyangia bacterium]
MPRTIDARLVGALALTALLAAAGRARANPRPLPFTYQAETLPAGAVEVEQFVDLVPVRVLSATSATNAPVWLLASEFQTEFEVGLTDRLELGLYVSFVPRPGEDFAQVPVLPFGNGLKQRLRYHLTDPERWPVDVALYGEVSENEREIELEGKIILQRRAGPVRFITNLWAEHELYLDGHREWVLNPTLGATAELSPRYSLGAEGWMRAEYPTDAPATRAFNLGPHVYAGPAFLASFGRLWWSTGAYVRLTELDRATQLGDAYGRFWFRTIIGLGF